MTSLVLVATAYLLFEDILVGVAWRVGEKRGCEGQVWRIIKPAFPVEVNMFLIINIS